MNKVLTFLFCTFFFQAFSAKIDVSITHASFEVNEAFYLEIYGRVNAESVTHQLTKDSMQVANITALVLIKLQDSILLADKFSLSSPAVKDPKDFWFNRKYQLDPGEYKLEYTFTDNSEEESSLNEQRTFTVASSESEKVQASDILLMANAGGAEKALPFTKDGFGFEPLAYDLVTPDLKNLVFNWELYRTDLLEGTHFISMTIYAGFGGTFGEKQMQKHKKVKPEKRMVILDEFPVLELPSGQYHITLELFNANKKQILYKERNFTVVQPITDISNQLLFDKEFENSFVQILNEEELDYSLRAIASQLTPNLVETLNSTLAKGNIATKKYFLYSYWSGISLDRPGVAYDAYMEVARAIDHQFGNNVGFGFETDRGHIFMKYGRPNDIVLVEDEINAPPYTIWVYYDFPFTDQSNVKFLFYSPSLSGEDFVLLHSTCKGELQNQRWEQVLYEDAWRERRGNTIDGTQMEDNFNRKARDYFRDN